MENLKYLFEFFTNTRTTVAWGRVAKLEELQLECLGQPPITILTGSCLYGLQFFPELGKESSESLVAPLYAIYKGFVTTCFAGVVKIPLIVKCAYIDYLKALERRQAELDRERKIKKKSG